MKDIPPNPPQAERLPKQFAHHYYIDMAYVAPPHTNNHHTFKRRIYTTLLQLAMNAVPGYEMRIVRKHPEVDWQRVWRNIHTSGLPKSIVSTWYAAIQDIFPTHVRLAAIHLVPTTACPRCPNQDTVIHRTTDCGDGPRQWTWTKQKPGRILRIDYKIIPKEWTIYPDIRIWSPTRTPQ